MDNVLAQANTADIGTLALLALAVMGFIWSLVSIKRSSPTDRINDLIRQRDEARADLDDCRRIVRGLERTISKLENGK